MKKNAMLKIAAVLLVAVLLTTCAISSTFAKYSSTGGSYVEEARVAKWGLTVSAIAQGDAFASSYGVANSGKTVKSQDGDVIAPGTTGTINVGFSVSGRPEVSCAVRVCDNADMTDSFEYIKVSNNLLDDVIRYDVSGVNVNETNISRSDVNNIIKGWNATYDPTAANATDINVGNDLVITWKWAFDATSDKDMQLADGTAKIFVNIYADVVQTGGANYQG